MVIVMEQHASEEQIQKVIESLVEVGYDVHRSTGVSHTVLGAVGQPRQVVDPTGAGDSFVGGMMGYLASRGNFESKTLKEALAYGTIVASFNVEDFSLDRMKQIERADLDKRLVEYRQMLSF